MDDSYWQVYLQLEEELKEIIYTVSFDKKQKGAYSPRIAELIVRIGMQIESVAQRLYKREKPNSEKANYKTALNYFDRKWSLPEKGIIVVADTIKSNNRRPYLAPLKNEVNKESFINGMVYYFDKANPTKTVVNVPLARRVKAYRWENAYNNLKHNFYESIERYGTVLNLLTIASALFILNVYQSPIYSTLELGLNVGRESDSFHSKSSVFDVFKLECAICDKMFVPVLPPWGQSLKFDWFSILEIRNVESIKNELDENFELIIDDKKYEIPKRIAIEIEKAKPYKNYHLTMKNQMRESDLVVIKK